MVTPNSPPRHVFRTSGRWAFSDLCEDYIKGIFAEWMVRTLIGPAVSRRRISYANCDILCASGLRIEVKATAFWQSWRVFDEEGVLRSPRIEPIRESRLKFGGLRSHSGADGNNSAGPRDYKGDLYVFCLQAQRDLECWDALDLGQWELYIVRRDQLEGLGTSAITLAKVRSLAAKMTAREAQNAC